MTYGRPSMTSHLPDVPLPRTDCDLDLAVTDLQTPGFGRDTSVLAFYVSTIKLYKILDKVLCDIYGAWCSGPSKNVLGTARRMKLGDLGIIIELDTELHAYEAGIPLFLSWKNSGQTSRQRSDQHCHIRASKKCPARTVSAFVIRSWTLHGLIGQVPPLAPLALPTSIWPVLC